MVIVGYNSAHIVENHAHDLLVVKLLYRSQNHLSRGSTSPNDEEKTIQVLLDSRRVRNRPLRGAIDHDIIELATGSIEKLRQAG